MNHLAVKFTFAQGVAPGEAAIACHAADIDFPGTNVITYAEDELSAMKQALGIIHVRRLERAMGLERGAVEQALLNKAKE